MVDPVVVLLRSFPPSLFLFPIFPVQLTLVHHWIAHLEMLLALFFFLTPVIPVSVVTLLVLEANSCKYALQNILCVSESISKDVSQA